MQWGLVMAKSILGTLPPASTSISLYAFKEGVSDAKLTFKNEAIEVSYMFYVIIKFKAAPAGIRGMDLITCHSSAAHQCVWSPDASQKVLRLNNPALGPRRDVHVH